MNLFSKMSQHVRVFRETGSKIRKTRFWLNFRVEIILLGASIHLGVLWQVKACHVWTWSGPQLRKNYVKLL